jgi:hypothetical protein
MSVTHFDYGTKLNKDTSPKNIPSGTAVAAFSHCSPSKSWIHYTAFLKKEQGRFHIEAVTDDAGQPEKVATRTPVGSHTRLEAVLSDVVKELNLIS